MFDHCDKIQAVKLPLPSDALLAWHGIGVGVPAAPRPGP